MDILKVKPPEEMNFSTTVNYGLISTTAPFKFANMLCIMFIHEKALNYG